MRLESPDPRPVNIAYIGVGGLALALRAQQHALQKRYRDLSRHGTIAGLDFELTSSMTPMPELPGLSEALALFTDSKGREVRDWTEDNLDQRIAAVRSKHPRAATALSGAVIAIYRHSSELLHGTYFSVIYFWMGSGQSGSFTKQSFAQTWFLDHFIAIFTALFLTANGVIETIRSEFGFPEDESQGTLVQRATSLTEAMRAGRPCNEQDKGKAH
jgi:hypothetical protein